MVQPNDTGGRPSAWSRRLLLVVLLAVGLSSVPGAPPGPVSGAEASTEPSASHPYGDPVWYPLRTTDGTAWKRPPTPGTLSALVGCVIENCQRAGRSGGHDHWALDLVGDRGDPVHAAGAGVLHVGDLTPCHSGKRNRGTWAWIDHGGGVVSRYHHLDTVAQELDGTLVTPATQIGTLGHTGGPCGGINYLHFQVLRGGLHGPQATPYDPGQLRACAAGVQRRYPRDLGAASWDDLNYGHRIPAGDSTCVTAAVTPAPPPSTRAQRGDRRVTLSWGEPAAVSPAVDGVTVVREIWHPSTGAWGQTTYRTVGATSRGTTSVDLFNGRTYRFRVAYRNREGHSRWGRWVQAVPAAPPDAPTLREVGSTRHDVIHRWFKPQHNGAPVTGYVVGIRRRTADGWTAWTHARVEGSLSHRWTGLPAGRTHQVRVRALSGAGRSAWSPVTRISTLR